MAATGIAQVIQLNKDFKHGLMLIKELLVASDQIDGTLFKDLAAGFDLIEKNCQVIKGGLF